MQYKGVKQKDTGGVQIDASIETTEIVGGGLKIGESADATERTIRWNNTTKRYEFYNGTSWVQLGGMDFSNEMMDFTNTLVIEH